MKENLRLKWERIQEEPIYVSILVLAILSALIIGISRLFYSYTDHSFFSQLLIEAHGMLFDIAFIGILIYWLNQRGDKKRRIRAYLDEIDDFRHWKSEEAAYRTVGNIKRLNRNGINSLDLSNCYLRSTNLSETDLTYSNLNSTDLSYCKMISAKVAHARFNQSDLSNATLNESDFHEAKLSGANLENAFLIKANLVGANLIKANLRGSYMMYTNLNGANLLGADLSGCNLFKADLRNVEGLTVEKLKEAKSLYQTRLDPELEEEIMSSFPELLVA
jgi:uncharacterized protein YjbI with pentapeptide repeats